jgi:hypothetical protein
MNGCLIYNALSGRIERSHLRNSKFEINAVCHFCTREIDRVIVLISASI